MDVFDRHYLPVVRSENKIGRCCDGTGVSGDQSSFTVVDRLKRDTAIWTNQIV